MNNSGNDISLCYITARLFDATLGRKSSISILLVFLGELIVADTGDQRGGQN